MKFISTLLFVFILTMYGCSSHQKNAEKKSLSLVPAPATFTGSFPCTDCDSIDITLNFRTDGLYQLRKTNVKGEARDTLTEMGRWKFDPAENIIVLGEKRGALKTLTLVDNDTLRLQDIEHKDIPAKLNYVLHKSDTFDPFPDPVPVRGMYRYLDNVGSFTECKSGVDFSVATKKDYPKLEHSYNTTPHGQGEALLVSVEGSLVPGPQLEGNGKDEMLVVDRFLEILPNQDCSGGRRQTELFNTTWRLAELYGKPISLVEGQKEPFVILEVEGNKMHGFSGCNRFFGTYLVKGEIFVFNKMASTRMACLKGLSLENGFLKAMSNTEAYRIRGNMLELRDRDEHILARLRATK